MRTLHLPVLLAFMAIHLFQSRLARLTLRVRVARHTGSLLDEGVYCWVYHELLDTRCHER